MHLRVSTGSRMECIVTEIFDATLGMVLLLLLGHLWLITVLPCITWWLEVGMKSREHGHL